MDLAAGNSGTIGSDESISGGSSTEKTGAHIVNLIHPGAGEFITA